MFKTGISSLCNVKLELDLTCGHCGSIDATELSFQSAASQLHISPLTISN